ncbi:MAG: Omp28-related outer membrane protein [Muribaculaceae bacterium]|nr:Omp28-related outer membrane protein [Muribaculaceae bacterium]
MKHFPDLRRMAIVGSLCLAAWSVATAAESPEGAVVHGFTLDTGFVSALSDNGQWASFRPADYDETDCIPRRLNLTTGEIETLPLNTSKYNGHVAAAYDITDDGLTLVGHLDRVPAYYRDGAWHELPLPPKTRGYSGYVTSVTPDGSVMCGWISLSFTSFRPVAWRDGELLELGEMPTYDEMYARHIIDDEDYAHHQAREQTPNVAFFKVSADGQVILAGVDHNLPGWGCSYIIYHVDEKTYDWIADDLVMQHGPGEFVSGASMSHSGEWVSCGVSGTVLHPDGTYEDRHTGAMYHVPTKTFTRGRGGGGIVDNDGVTYGGGIPSLSEGITVPVPMITKQKYGIDFEKATQLGPAVDGFMLDISADGRTVVGQTQPRLYVYSVTTPVPLREAADGINMLAECTLFPPEGIELSRVEYVMLRFDSAASPVEGVQARVVRDGETVGISSGTEHVQGNVWKILFPSIALEEGMEYTVMIPEGMFKGRGSASRNMALTLPLTGHADTPLSPLAVSPAPDSPVIELGAYNMVTLDFDTYPNPTGIPAQLYEKGTDILLCSLGVAGDGRQLYVYPSATRRLGKGREYEVVIPAGAVADLMGHRLNEEIRISYRGSYVPDIPEGMTALFYDDFEYPNESLGNFLQYEGDHQRPIADMRDWGFDADNTPWNFSVRDDDNFDYCAASHSMYVGVSEPSDDWLVIPRLPIDSEWYRLRFKTQSYFETSYDRLKVIVWPCDEVFGSLDAPTVDRMRQEGTVIYDEVVRPGADEFRLAGDWTEVSLSLADFKGRNVYIAFVNENDREGSAVFVDDIMVVYEGDFRIAPLTPSTVVAANEVDISARVQLLDKDRHYDLLEAEWTTADGSQRGSVTIREPEADEDNCIMVVFPETLRPEGGCETSYTITVTLDGERQSVSHTVANLLFDVTGRVLVEEGTGAWCGFCPQGFVALEYLDANYGDRVVPVSVHCRDAFAFDAYDQFLALGAYPSARINRSQKVYYPIFTDPVTGRYSLSSLGGDQTFVDAVESELARPCVASLEIGGVSLDERRVLTVEGELRMAMRRDDAAYNLLTVLTEDGLKGVQTNYLTGNTDPLFAEWSAKDGQVLTEYPDVARMTAGNSFYGESGVVPDVLVAGEKYPLGARMVIPEDVNIGNTRVVMVLIDATSGRVVNVARSGLLSSDLNGVGSIASAAGFELHGKMVLFNGSHEDVEVYGPDGLRLVNGALPRGLVIARHGASSARILIP